MDLTAFLSDKPLLAFGGLLVSFLILAKSADWFVDGAVGIAEIFRLPKMLIGIVLVGFATTTPELFVSVQAAARGMPEIALGNALGSVMVDGFAMGLAGILAATAIVIHKSVLIISGTFVTLVGLVAYGFALDGTFSRIEGVIVIAMFCGYVAFACWHARKEAKRLAPGEHGEADDMAIHSHSHTLKQAMNHLGCGLLGVMLSSKGVLDCSVAIAIHFEVSKIVIALTLVAIGTSLPEIATCAAAALKGEGSIAAGDIIGADILNICWIIGASSVVNPITVPMRTIHFAFCFALLIIVVMLGMMAWRWKFHKVKGLVLIFIYIAYLVLVYIVIGPSSGPMAGA